jgi:hypothetical protein
MKLFSLLDTQYNDFISNVNNYLSKVLSNHNTSFGSNTVFGQIITVVGNAIQNVMLYIEDALVEQNKYTAQRKKSIYGLAALSGYAPSYGKAATVSIKLSHTPNNIINVINKPEYNIIINNKESLTCTQNGLKYNIILPQECVIINNTDPHTRYFTAVQGIFETQRFISEGGKYYTINFKFVGNIDTDYMIVKVNNEEWEQVASIYDMSSAAKQYTFKPSITGGIDLIFGNECRGKALRPNDLVEVSYLIHDGETGNLDAAAETYFVFDNTLSDTDGDTYDGNGLFNTTFAETDPVTSGSNSETIEHVREMIGYNSRSLVLASPENYKVLLSKFGFCGYNRTWSDPNSMTINSLIIKNFKTKLASGKNYFDLKEDDFKLSDAQKNSLYSYIRNSGGQLVSMNYNIYDPELCKYAMYIYVTLKNGKVNKELISKQIRLAIGEFFTDIQSDYFIPKSDIIQVLKNNVEGIDGVNIYFLSQKNEEALYTGEYVNETHVVNSLTGQYNVKKENIRLEPGENPNLGLDNHGNILLTSSAQFPVLMGGWAYKNLEDQLIEVIDPLNIIFEEQ